MNYELKSLAMKSRPIHLHHTNTSS